MYATNGVGDALAAWLAVRGREPGPLFVGAQRSRAAEPAAQPGHGERHCGVDARGALEPCGQRLQVLEGRPAAGRDGPAGRAEPHRRHREPRQKHGDELEDRPAARRSREPAEQHRRHRSSPPEPLMVFVPHHAPPPRRRQQRSHEVRHVGRPPDAVAEIPRVGDECHAASPLIVEPQHRRAPIGQVQQGVLRRRRNGLALAFLQLPGPHPQTRLGRPVIPPWLEKVGDRGQGKRARRRNDAKAVAREEHLLVVRTPTHAPRDAPTRAGGYHAAARANEPHHLRQLGRVEAARWIEHQQHRRRGPVRRVTGEIKERRAPPLDRDPEPRQHIVHGATALRAGDQGGGAEIERRRAGTATPGDEGHGHRQGEREREP